MTKMLLCSLFVFSPVMIAEFKKKSCFLKLGTYNFKNCFYMNFGIIQYKNFFRYTSFPDTFIDVFPTVVYFNYYYLNNILNCFYPYNSFYTAFIIFYYQWLVIFAVKCSKNIDLSYSIICYFSHFSIVCSKIILVF